MKVHCLTFNPFEENTYILYDASGECIIVDPGCSTASEERTLSGFIEDNNLTPVRLVNTHAHIDHVYGINYVYRKYGLPLYLHEGELPVLRLTPQIAMMYGVQIDPIDVPVEAISEDEVVKFGETELEIRFTPGHSPASICLIDVPGKQAIVGDVLFQGSIGRTDLPGGDYDTLIGSIADQLLTLDDDFVIFPGHGPSTTIGAERKYNPFLTGIR